MTTFQIGQGAERPSVAYGFTVDGAPANLTGAGSVTFRMRPANGTAATVNAAGTVTDATATDTRVSEVAVPANKTKKGKSAP
jgi:hypothetical protein